LGGEKMVKNNDRKVKKIKIMTGIPQN